MNQYNPDTITPPSETIIEMLLAHYVDSANITDADTQEALMNVVYHNAEITDAIARHLEAAIGAPASFWINRERRYRESLKVDSIAKPDESTVCPGCGAEILLMSVGLFNDSFYYCEKCDKWTKIIISEE